MESSGCYGGGDIAGAVIGSLIGGLVLAYVLYRLYMHYWRNRKDNNLVQEDPENAKQEFAFDNPAFRNEKQKASNNSPLDTKWTFNKKSAEKRANESINGNTATRSVALRGSDFTGLGIEICGGLKEGIYVRKVMPQGPAAQIVHTGDKIISITIDLQHMVQEDAATLLSLASPYNVQLELCDGNGTLPRSVAQSPAHSVISNGGTLEAPNARRNLFPQQQTADEAISNYPTLKLESTPASSSQLNTTTTTTTTTTVHRENEKQQQRAASPVPVELHASSGGHVEVSFSVAAKTEPEPISQSAAPAEVTPPIVNKRTKHLKNAEIETVKLEEKVTAAAEISANDAHKEPIVEPPSYFQRMGSINSSGIKRDAAGIPQEIPDQMFAAAMAARGNRKSTGALQVAAEAEDATLLVAEAEEAAEKVRKQVKAPPRPPARGDSLVENRTLAVSGSDVTNIDIESITSSPIVENQTTAATIVAVNEDDVGDQTNVIVEQVKDIINEPEHPATSINIELNANHITVHHSSNDDETHNNASPVLEAPIPNKRQYHHQEIRITDETENHQHNSHPVAAPADIQPTVAEPPEPKPRTSVISLDSSLVEQVLAVADGFSQETRATLSRQLSELNEDHIPAGRFDIETDYNSLNRSQYNDMDIGTQEEILNNYKFKAEPVLLSMSSMSQYQFESDQSGPSSSIIAISSAKEPAVTVDQADSGRNHVVTINSNDAVDHRSPDGHDRNANNIERNIKMSYGINIPDDVKVSRITADDAAQAASATATQLANGTSAITPSSSAAVFSSDGHGINSISISSLDISADDLEHIVSQPSSIIAIDDEDLDFTPQSPHMDAAPQLNGTAESRKSNSGTHDVFIIESLSSMKTHPQTSIPVASPEPHSPASNYVTEIQLANPNNQNNHNGHNSHNAGSPQPLSSLPPPAASARLNGTKPPSPPRVKQQRSSPPATVDRIPRNTEMKFTTATYESATQRHLSSGIASPSAASAAARQQAVDQIRSTFERGHTQSEIPVLVRRPSIPASPPAPFSGGSHSQSTSSLSSLPRTSPSKIPVFNSASTGGSKSGYSSSGSERAASISGGSSTGHSPPVQARTNGNGFLYRSHSSLNSSAARGAAPVVGVTVTAIKSASRNPSGK